MEMSTLYRPSYMNSSDLDGGKLVFIPPQSTTKGEEATPLKENNEVEDVKEKGNVIIKIIFIN